MAHEQLASEFLGYVLKSMFLSRCMLWVLIEVYKLLFLIIPLLILMFTQDSESTFSGK